MKKSLILVIISFVGFVLGNLLAFFKISKFLDWPLVILVFIVFPVGFLVGIIGILLTFIKKKIYKITVVILIMISLGVILFLPGTSCHGLRASRHCHSLFEFLIHNH